MESLDAPVAVAAPPVVPSRVLPANLLYLITLALILTVGIAVQARHVWTGLLLTELYLILLPALLFAAGTGSLRTALRLKWVGPGPCCMGLAIGAGLFPVALGAGWVGSKILGYSVEMPDGFLPTAVGEKLVYVLAVAFAAPICEEMVFRGYILSAYERAGWRPRTAILTVAAMFTAWHLSPFRFLPVAVLALAITFVAWRTGSIWPSMAAHMGANGTAALLAINRQSILMQHPILWVVAIGAILGPPVAALCLWRIAAGPARTAALEIPTAPVKAVHWWPLAVAASIVAIAAGAEIVKHRFPDLLPAHEDVSDKMRTEAPWKGQADWFYEIYADSKPIGEADYHLLDQGPAGTLLFGSATFRTANHLTGTPMKMWFDASWDKDSLALGRFFGEMTRQGKPESPSRYTFRFTGKAAYSGQAWLEDGLYSPYELPWRLSAASLLEAPRTQTVSLPHLSEARLGPEEPGPLPELVIQVSSHIETYRTPAGSFQTVRLAMPDATVWYDVEAPHAVLRYLKAGTEWVLVRRQN